MTNPIYGWTIGQNALSVKIVESVYMTEVIEDWTRVRSPSRAKRRMRYGHRQNIQYHTVPRRDVISLDGGRTLVCHPAVLRELGKRLSQDMEKRMDALLTQSLYGPQPTVEMEADRVTKELFARLREERPWILRR